MVPATPKSSRNSGLPWSKILISEFWVSTKGIVLLLVLLFLFSSVHPDLFLINHRMVAQPKPVATLRCESGFGRADRKSLLQRPSCQVINWLVSLALKKSPAGQSQPARGWGWSGGIQKCRAENLAYSLVGLTLFLKWKCNLFVYRLILASI